MSKTKDRIRESNLRYKQSLGQNFIYDEDLLASLVADAGIDKEDDVLEIGPGAGSLTKHLCAAAHHVLSLELDERLIPLLNAFMAGQDNFSLVQGDVMAVDLEEITGELRKPFAVVANIPYYITTPLITRLLTSGLPISKLALMVQKEVAEKILSSPGEEGWGPLAVRCQYLCEPYLAQIVPASCFTPVPKVDSAFIVLPRRQEPAVRVKDEKAFSLGDWVFIPGVRKAVLEGTPEFTAYAVNPEGKVTPFQVSVGDLTPDERQIIADGCLINYYRNHPVD